MAATYDRCPRCVDCHRHCGSCWDDTGHLFRSRGVKRMWLGESITPNRPKGTRPLIPTYLPIQLYLQNFQCNATFQSIKPVPHIQLLAHAFLSSHHIRRTFLATNSPLLHSILIQPTIYAVTGSTLGNNTFTCPTRVCHTFQTYYPKTYLTCGAITIYVNEIEVFADLSLIKV